MLFDSRNRTYSDDTPVNPGDMNDLQDAVIGAKHGPLSLVLHASKFAGIDIVYDFTLPWAKSTAAAAAIRYANASIDLPAGTLITSIDFWYNRAGAGTVTPSLNQHRLSTGLQVFQWNGIGDATGAAIESQTITPNHVMVAGDAYFAQFLVTDPASRIYGAKVNYKRP